MVADNGKGHFVIVKNRLPPSEIFSKALISDVPALISPFSPYRKKAPVKKKILQRRKSKDGIIIIIFYDARTILILIPFRRRS